VSQPEHGVWEGTFDPLEKVFLLGGAIHGHEGKGGSHWGRKPKGTLALVLPLCALSLGSKEGQMGGNKYSKGVLLTWRAGEFAVSILAENGRGSLTTVRKEPSKCVHQTEEKGWDLRSISSLKGLLACCSEESEQSKKKTHLKSPQPCWVEWVI